MLADLSIIAWIDQNHVVNEFGRPLSFESHFFLYDIYTDWSKAQAIRKGTQIGESTEKIVKTGYAAGVRGYNVIYTLPTDEAVSEFVRQKWDKIAENNPSAFGVMETDNVGMKEIGGRFVTFKGTRSTTGALMSTADILIHDEIDRSDLSMVEAMESRVGASNYGAIWKLSNPSTPEIGIDKAYLNSDQKRWFIRCLKCRKEQYLTFESNVDQDREIYVCAGCTKELKTEERADGRWKPLNPGHPVSGYHIDQLMAPWVPASKVVSDFKNKDRDYFYNFTLGLPYQDSEAIVGPHLVLDNWTTKSLRKPPYFLGIDVGRVKHFVLGSEAGIFSIGRFEDWGYIDELMAAYDPFTVIDALPETTMSDSYRKKYPGKIWTSYYNKDRAKAELVNWGDGKEYGLVWSDRSRLIGKTVNDFLNGNILVSVEPGEELDLYVKHVTTIRKLKESETRLQTKIETTLSLEAQTRYVWTTISAEDHYAHATFYYTLARQKAGDVAFISTSSQKGRLIEEVAPGQYQVRLKEKMIEQGLEDNTEE